MSYYNRPDEDDEPLVYSWVGEYLDDEEGESLPMKSKNNSQLYSSYDNDKDGQKANNKKKFGRELYERYKKSLGTDTSKSSYQNTRYKTSLKSDDSKNTTYIQSSSHLPKEYSRNKGENDNYISQYADKSIPKYESGANPYYNSTKKFNDEYDIEGYNTSHRLENSRSPSPHTVFLRKIDSHRENRRSRYSQNSDETDAYLQEEELRFMEKLEKEIKSTRSLYEKSVGHNTPSYREPMDHDSTKTDVSLPNVSKSLYQQYLEKSKDFSTKRQTCDEYKSDKLDITQYSEVSDKLNQLRREQTYGKEVRPMPLPMKDAFRSSRRSVVSDYYSEPETAMAKQDSNQLHASKSLLQDQDNTPGRKRESYEYEKEYKTKKSRPIEDVYSSPIVDKLYAVRERLFAKQDQVKSSPRDYNYKYNDDDVNQKSQNSEYTSSKKDDDRDYSDEIDEKIISNRYSTQDRYVDWKRSSNYTKDETKRSNRNIKQDCYALDDDELPSEITIQDRYQQKDSLTNQSAHQKRYEHEDVLQSQSTKQDRHQREDLLPIPSTQQDRSQREYSLPSQSTRQDRYQRKETLPSRSTQQDRFQREDLLPSQSTKQDRYQRENALPSRSTQHDRYQRGGDDISSQSSGKRKDLYNLDEVELSRNRTLNRSDLDPITQNDNIIQSSRNSKQDKYYDREIPSKRYDDKYSRNSSIPMNERNVYPNRSTKDYNKDYPAEPDEHRVIKANKDGYSNSFKNNIRNILKAGNLLQQENDRVREEQRKIYAKDGYYDGENKNSRNSFERNFSRKTGCNNFDDDKYQTRLYNMEMKMDNEKDYIYDNFYPVRNSLSLQQSPQTDNRHEFYKSRPRDVELDHLEKVGQDTRNIKQTNRQNDFVQSEQSNSALYWKKDARFTQDQRNVQSSSDNVSKETDYNGGKRNFLRKNEYSAELDWPQRRSTDFHSKNTTNSPKVLENTESKQDIFELHKVLKSKYNATLDKPRVAIPSLSSYPCNDKRVVMSKSSKTHGRSISTLRAEMKSSNEAWNSNAPSNRVVVPRDKYPSTVVASDMKWITEYVGWFDRKILPYLLVSPNVVSRDALDFLMCVSQGDEWTSPYIPELNKGGKELLEFVDKYNAEILQQTDTDLPPQKFKDLSKHDKPAPTENQKTLIRPVQLTKNKTPNLKTLQDFKVVRKFSENQEDSVKVEFDNKGKLMPAFSSNGNQKVIKPKVVTAMAAVNKDKDPVKKKIPKAAVPPTKRSRSKSNEVGSIDKKKSRSSKSPSKEIKTEKSSSVKNSNTNGSARRRISPKRRSGSPKKRSRSPHRRSRSPNRRHSTGLQRGPNRRISPRRQRSPPPRPRTPDRRPSPHTIYKSKPEYSPIAMPDEKPKSPDGIWTNEEMVEDKQEKDSEKQSMKKTENTQHVKIDFKEQNYDSDIPQPYRRFGLLQPIAPRIYACVRIPDYTDRQLKSLTLLQYHVEKAVKSRLNCLYKFENYTKNKVDNVAKAATANYQRLHGKNTWFSIDDVSYEIKKVLENTNKETMDKHVEITLKEHDDVSKVSENNLAGFLRYRALVFQLCKKYLKPSNGYNHTANSIEQIENQADLAYPVYCGIVPVLVKLWNWRELVLMNYSDYVKCNPDTKFNSHGFDEANIETFMNNIFQCPPYELEVQQSCSLVRQVKITLGNETMLDEVLRRIVKWWSSGYYHLKQMNDLGQMTKIESNKPSEPNESLVVLDEVYSEDEEEQLKSLKRKQELETAPTIDLF